MMEQDKRYTVHMQDHDGRYVLLYGDHEREVRGFLKFWALYRPYVQIEIRCLNSDGIITVIYNGDAKGAKGFLK